MASRKDLAGLAALGALGYMLRDKTPDMRGGAEDERPAPTGMGEATQLLPDRNEDFSNEGRTGTLRTPVGAVPRRPSVGPVVRSSQLGSQQFPMTKAPSAPDMSWNTVTPDEAQRRKKMEQQQALEAVRPEEAMIGGGGLKTVAALARGLAGRRGAEKLAEYSVPRIGTETVPRIGTEALKIGKEPLKMTGPSKAELLARDRAARAAGREAERQEFNKRGADRFIESTFEGGMKRGGKVKKMASGGVTRSSASKRADGIATKGKTRGRMY